VGARVIYLQRARAGELKDSPQLPRGRNTPVVGERHAKHTQQKKKLLKPDEDSQWRHRGGLV